MGGRTQTGLVVLAKDCIDTGYLTHDNFQGGTVDLIAVGYDWLYDVLDAEQRSDVVRVVDLFAAHNLKGMGFWFSSTKTGTKWTMSYVNPTVQRQSAAKRGSGHPWANMIYALQAVLCTIPESTSQDTRDFFEIAVNYMIARTFPYGGAQEGGYNVGVRYSALSLNRVVPRTMFMQCRFPEMHFERNPFWASLADWHMRAIPVGMVEADSPWGDTGWGESKDWERGGLKIVYALANSGAALQHSRNQLALRRKFRTDEAWNDLVLFSTFTNSFSIRPENITSNAAIYPVGGWAFGSSRPVNTYEAWTNGCGFIFCARPRGNDYMHDHAMDLSYQFWAYGSTITDAGGGMYPYAKIPMAHNVLLVNGLGEAQPKVQWCPNYCKLAAFETGSNYVYVAAEATRAYPVTNFTVTVGWLTPSQYTTLHSGGPLSGLTGVIRHILFMRGRYWVIYDSLASKTPSTFSWLYHIYENTVSQVDSNNASFTYTSNTRKLTGYDAKAPAVTVLVQHIAGNVTLTDMNGTNVRSNPITGENYYNDGNMSRIRAHAMWVSNRTPATNFHFLSVVYPIKPGASPPEIKRLDDYTVEVTNGNEHDVISFDSRTKHPATFLVDLPSLTGTSQPIEATNNASRTIMSPVAAN
jgi:hypothetical protein